MKLKSLILTLLVMAAGAVSAQIESGKVYRIVNAKYETVITESIVTRGLSCVKPGGDTDYQEMWKITLEEEGKYSLMNVYTRRYINDQNTQEVQYKTGEEKVLFEIGENATLKSYYNIDIKLTDNWGLHCNGGGTVVPWGYGTDVLSATEWRFEKVDVTDAAMEAAYSEFAAYNEVLSKKDEHIAIVNNLFEDKAGTKLKAEYASMSDDALRAEMASVPAELQNIVLKIKNDSWAKADVGYEHLSEKNFRIYDYKPYSNPEKWAEILYTRAFNRINNPTGISTINDKSLIYVFVDEIPEGTEVYLAEMQDCKFWGNDTELQAGLNIVPAVNVNGSLFVRYVCDTHTGKLLPDKSGVDLTQGKKLSDYPTLKVHIEGGYVNGFWSKERGHTNADWVYMGQKMFQNPTAVQAVGDHSVLNFRKKEFLQPFEGEYYWDFKVQGCPEKITEVMAMWDFWNERQKHYMNLEKYAEYHNNKQLAMSDDGGFMDASQYRTHYNNNTLTEIVNIDRITRDAGSAWGPNHEIGHTNQYAFEIVGTSEVSNNALANFVIFDQGTHTSRGQNMTNQILNFEKKVPYVVRGEGRYDTQLFSMTRMYFQLFLYFHALGHNEDFYPQLFERLRYDKLEGWSVTSKDEFDENGFYKNSVNAAKDQLKFAEICCEIGNTDLTEFFEAWGFFIPFKNEFVGDYGHHWVYLLQEDIDACKARIKAKNYPKKGGHLMFLEDRVKESPFNPNKELDAIVGLSEMLKNEPYIKNGYRGNYADWDGESIGTVGNFGQWNDYKDETVKAEGYYYSVSNGKVTIIEDKDAKGALGFKMYDKETGELLTFTNTYTMNVPARVAGKELRIVAAQACGEDAEVKPASEGPESMQLTALEAALKRANTYLNNKAVNGYEIGRFLVESLTTLQTLYNEAKADYDNRATAGYTPKKSFADWSVELANECDRLLTSDGARLRIEEGMTFVMLNTSANRAVLINCYEGLVLSSKVDMFDYEAAGWSVEYAGTPNKFYLKNANGKYIDNIAYDATVFAETSAAANAEIFTVTYTEDGKVYFTAEGDSPLSFGKGAASMVNGTEVIGVLPTENAALYVCYVKNDDSKNFYKEALNEALDNVSYIIKEIIVEEQVGTMNMFKENVLVNDQNLTETATQLYNEYKKIKEEFEANANDVNWLRTKLNLLRDYLNKIDGTYVVTSPLATSGDEVVFYYLRDKETGKYLSVNDRERMTTVNYNAVDDKALWSFASTGKQNEYQMYNYGTGAFPWRKSATATTIYVNNEEQRMPVAVTYDTDNHGVVIAMGDMAFKLNTSGIVALKPFKDVPTQWVLELAYIEKNKDLAGVVILSVEDVLFEGNEDDSIYDLFGRKVQNPERGIYIQNGRKVYFK